MLKKYCISKIVFYFFLLVAVLTTVVSCKKKEVSVISASLVNDTEDVVTNSTVTTELITNIVYDKEQIDPESSTWYLRDNKDNEMQALTKELKKIVWQPKEPGLYKLEIVALYKDGIKVRRNKEVQVYPDINYFKEKIIGNFAGTARPQWNTNLFWTLNFNVSSNLDFSTTYTNIQSEDSVIGNGRCFYFPSDVSFTGKKINFTSVNSVGIGQGSISLKDTLGEIKQHQIEDAVFGNDGRNLSFTFIYGEDQTKKIKYSLSK
jgi:hypothetical protein